MIDFQQIKAEYPDNLHLFRRALLREYLQYKILQAIFESKHASKLAFLGGTALRIIWENGRFSEDIDLDNFGLNWQEFEEVIQKTHRFLTLEGFDVEMRAVAKGAYHCYLKFPQLLYEQGLSPHQEEKILIQIDTMAQGFEYQPEIRILNQFDVFTQIRVTPLNILLSQKIYTAVNRKRAKGRDFFDITFLFSKTKPDFGFLHQKMGITTPDGLRNTFSDKIATYDFNALAQDVAPFLMHKEQVNRVKHFRLFWEQVKIE